MSSLATKAFALSKKPTKKRAMSIVEKLSFKLGDTDELAELYSYFKPATPSKPKSPSDWVFKAMAKNDVRIAITRAEVSDGVIVCTDGHRLHLCTTSLRNGAYDNQLNRIDEDVAGRFPDWKRVVPDNRNRPGAINLREAKIIEHHTEIPGYKGGTIIGDFIDVQFGDTVIRFNNKYWTDAITMFTGKAMVRYATDKDSILISEDDKKAVVMPIKV